MIFLISFSNARFASATDRLIFSLVLVPRAVSETVVKIDGVLE